MRAAQANANALASTWSKENQAYVEQLFKDAGNFKGFGESMGKNAAQFQLAADTLKGFDPTKHDGDHGTGDHSTGDHGMYAPKGPSVSIIPTKEEIDWFKTELNKGLFQNIDEEKVVKNLEKFTKSKEDFENFMDVYSKQTGQAFNKATMKGLESDDSEVATLNKNTDQLEYKKPTHIHHYDNYQGKMYEIQNSNISLNVTGNHRMLVSKTYGRKRKWLPYDYEKAEDIIGKHRKYKRKN